MARRPAVDGEGVGARLRIALVEHRRRFIPLCPPFSASVVAAAEADLAEYEARVMGGDELVLDSDTLHGAFWQFDEAAAVPFRFAHDREGKRRWLLTRDDQLIELEPDTDGRGTRTARLAAEGP
jgi:hypothetical protein